MNSEDKKNLIINIFLTALYGLFTLVTVLHHEIWSDEAQVWQIVQNVSFVGLFKHLVNEGHPSFFYLLIMPFAKIFHYAGSIMIMQIICWIFMSASVFLLLQFSSFSKLSKFAIVTSAGFLYFLPVNARSYAILPFFVFLAAFLYPKVKEKPILYSIILAIIANTHVIMFGFCAALFALFVFENREKKYIPSYCIMAFGLLAVVLQLIGTSSSNEFISYGQYDFLSSTLSVFSKFFINGYDDMYQKTHQFLFPPTAITAILTIAVLFFANFVALFKINKKMFFIASLSVAFQFFVYIYSYNVYVYVTRIYCAYIILIFCWWIALNSSNLKEKTIKISNICISIFFILTMFNGLKYTLLDLQYNFSSSKQTAEFINENIDKDALIIENFDPVFVSILPYLKDRTLYSASTNKDFHYIKWGNELKQMKSDYGLLEYIQKLKTNKKIYLVISSFKNLNSPSESFPNEFTQVFESSPSIAEGQSFKIYEYTGITTKN